MTSARLRPRRLLLVFCLMVVAGLVLMTTANGAKNQDIELNEAPGLEFQGGQNDCWRHHITEGMTDSHVVIPIFPQSLDLFTPRELRVAVENSWKYTLVELKVQLNLTNAPGIIPLIGAAAEAAQKTVVQESATLGNRFFRQPQPDGPVNPLIPPETFNVTVDVGPNPVAMFARVEFQVQESAQGVGQPESFTAAVFDPDDDIRNPREADPMDPQGGIKSSVLVREMTLPRGQGVSLQTLVPGPWTFQFTYEGGDTDQVDLAFNATVLYQAVGEGVYDVYEKPREPADRAIAPPVTIVPDYQTLELPPIPIMAIKEGPQEIGIMIEARLYWDHQAGATPDEDSFRRYAFQVVQAGGAYVPASEVNLAGGSSKADFFLKAGEITGFGAAFLLFPSLLFGGTYGKGSRKLFNNVLGGAKRRVMFHNLLSLGLTLVAAIHIVFFLLEFRYTVLMGVLWGGLSALSLLVLGLTGYYQVPLIQKYGYNWWRYLHLVAGLLVVVFVGYHAIADGPDFFFIKEQLPKWINDFNLVQK